MRRFILLLVFALAVTAALRVAPAPAQSSQVQPIADGVWFRLGERDQGHCNNVIIDLGESLLIVDANFPSGAQALMQDLNKISSKPVKYVFDTHHHGDHAYGNPIWTKAGATTIAYIGVAQEIRRYEPARWRAASQTRRDVADLHLDTLQPPQKTFSESPFVINEGGRRVELHHFGWAHTRGDGFAFLPAEKILCSGDAIVNGPFNYTGDGNTGNWPNVARAAQKLGAVHVLPGHGAPGGAEVIAGQLSFFEQINSQVGAAFDAGKKLSDIVTVQDGAGVSTTLKITGPATHWVGDRFAEQVRVRYAELAEGKPHGEILGGS